MLLHINALRAISVILVVFYHFNISFFQFGFLGVDIFFVISGYLISKIISEEFKSTKKFDIYNFLLRRARRLFPVIFFFLILSIVTAYFLNYDDKIFLSNSIFSNILLVPNFFFWLNDIDYFSEFLINANFLKHTWSLGVEYQFYFLVSLSFLFFKKNIKFFIYFVFLISIITDYQLINVKPSASFYLIPTRLWEFFFGTIFYLDRKKLFNFFCKVKFLDIILLAIILLNIFFLNDINLFFKKFFVVFSSAILIAFYEKKNTFGNLLDNKFLNYIGLLSFSLYLWHYFLFKLFDYYHYNLSIFLILIISIFLSIFSYHFIEIPFRKKEFYLNLNFKLLSAIFVLVIFFTGLIKNDILGYYKYDKEFIKSFERDNRFEKCHAINFDSSKDYSECYIGNIQKKNIDFIIMGDSIAYSLSQSFNIFGKNKKLKGIFFSQASCPSLKGINFFKYNIKRKKICERFNNNIFNFIKKNNIKKAFLISNWENYLKNPIFDDNQNFEFKGKNLTSKEEKRLFILEMGLKKTLSELQSYNVEVKIFNQLPILRFQDAKKIANKEIQLKSQNELETHDKKVDSFLFSKRDFLTFKSRTDQMLKRIFSTNELIDVTNFYCEKYCTVTKDKKSLYNDNIHFSGNGAKYFSSILQDIL
jgi:peptidoglycan/LPS O-acetylase OafA/YrhL